jgi:MoCo/4Fe-4S cofactor protein with predicted Tat translocation signal
MNESGKGGAQGHCKSAKEHLVQIGGPAVPAYWKSPEELRNGPRRSAEFPGGLPSSAAREETTRRDFLAAMGFSSTKRNSSAGGIGRDNSRRCQLVCHHMPRMRLLLQFAGKAA